MYCGNNIACQKAERTSKSRAHVTLPPKHKHTHTPAYTHRNTHTHIHTHRVATIPHAKWLSEALYASLHSSLRAGAIYVSI